MCGLKTTQGIYGLLVGSMVGFLPVWPYSAGWGFSFSGKIAVVLAIFMILKITKRI